MNRLAGLLPGAKVTIKAEATDGKEHVLLNPKNGPIAFAAGPGVERTDGKAFATAPPVSVVSFHMNAATHAATPPNPPVPPPSPTRAPLALRI